MEPKAIWRGLDDSLLIQVPPHRNNTIPGKKSHEKRNQTLRESMCKEVIYPFKNL